MATGTTNVVNAAGGSGKFTWELAEQFSENEVYYERFVNQLDTTNPIGTYILLDKAYIGSLRTSSYGSIYGNYSIGSGSGTVCFRLEQRVNSGGGVKGPYWDCYGIGIKNNTNWIYVYFKMDSGDTNVGQCLDSYYDMPNVLRNAYEGEYNRSVLSIFDNSSSILGSLRLFTNLATVKVSDKIMGVDYNTREELLELENRSSIKDWVDSLTTYSEIDLTSSTFIPYKYWIKKPVE